MGRRCLLLVLALLFLVGIHQSMCNNVHGADMDDNEFAEFEEFDDEEDAAEFEDSASVPKQAASQQNDDMDDIDMVDEDEASVEDEDDEFEHFNDDEEFVGFDKEKPGSRRSQDKPPDLKINKVPYHLRTNWDSFYMEMLMLAGLGVYLLNFLAGKSKNSKLAQAWYTSHKDLLEKHFAIVGDDGQTTEVQSGQPMKESENIYALWCSGRVCVEGMLVTLRLLKRQDLISTIARMFKTASDQITIKVTMEENEMDTYVLCLAKRNIASKVQKETTDLSQYCLDKKGADKYGLPGSFQVLSEIGEATSTILDRQVQAVVKKYEDVVEYIHVSDQYSGPKQQDDGGPPKIPETKKVVLVGLNVRGKGSSNVHNMEELQPLMSLVFHIIDRVHRFRLSKEAKVKANKNRQKVEETYMKATHSQRQEAAQQRREDKRRAEKERIMAEEDPDRQRRLEDRENKREAKRRQPKVKVMKVM